MAGTPAALVKIDVTENAASARKYGVSQLPTIKLIRGGEMIDDYAGQRNSGEIISYLTERAGNGNSGGSGGGGSGGGGGAGEPEIVMRNGEERVFIPINRDEPPAAVAVGGGGGGGGGGGDKKMYTDPDSFAAAKANMGGDNKPHHGGGASQRRGKRKPTFARMEQVGLEALEPGRGFTLEQWIFDPVRDYVLKMMGVHQQR